MRGLTASLSSDSTSVILYNTFHFDVEGRVLGASCCEISYFALDQSSQMSCTVVTKASSTILQHNVMAPFGSSNTLGTSSDLG